MTNNQILIFSIVTCLGIVAFIAVTNWPTKDISERIQDHQNSTATKKSDKQKELRAKVVETPTKKIEPHKKSNDSQPATIQAHIADNSNEDRKMPPEELGVLEEDDGQSIYEYNHNDSLPDKLLISHGNTQVAIDAEMQEGIRDGRFLAWHENGSKAEEGYYEQGLKHGSFTTWLENGQVWEESEYQEGKRINQTIRWNYARNSVDSEVEDENKNSTVIIDNDSTDKDEVRTKTPHIFNSDETKQISDDANDPLSENVVEEQKDQTPAESYAGVQNPTSDKTAQKSPEGTETASVAQNVIGAPRSLISEHRLNLSHRELINSDVQVFYTSIRYNRRDETLVVRLRLMSTAATAIEAPIYFSAENITFSEIEMINPGIMGEDDSPIFIVDEPLEPGQSTTFELIFANTQLRRFAFDPMSFKINFFVSIDSPTNLLLTNISDTNVTGSIEPNILSVTVNGEPAMITGESYIVEQLSLNEGTNTVIATGLGFTGETTTSTVTVTLDSIAPEINITSLPDQTTTANAPLSVSGDVSETVDELTVNGIAATIDGSTFTATDIVLQEGDNTINAVGTDFAGNVGNTSITVVLDTINPAVSVTFPSDQSTTTNISLPIFGEVSEDVAGVTVNGVAASFIGSRNWTTVIPAKLGSNSVVAVATDKAGNQGTATINITRNDPIVLAVTVTDPFDGFVTNNPNINVTGTVNDPLARVSVQNVVAEVDQSEYQARAVPLLQGANEVTIHSQNNEGSEVTTSVAVILDMDSPEITILSPLDRALVSAADVTIKAAVDDFTTTTCMVSNTDVAINNGLMSTTVMLQEGENQILIRCTDSAENATTEELTLYFDSNPLQISSVTPVNGADEIPVTTSISIDFSEPLNPNSVNGNTIFLRSDSALIASDFTLLNGNQSIVIGPNSDLPSGTELEITITSGVADSNGNPLSFPFVSRFSTAGQCVLVWLYHR